MVRVHPDPPDSIVNLLDKWGISSAGRAPALQAGGRRFDPDILHHIQSFMISFCEIIKSWSPFMGITLML